MARRRSAPARLRRRPPARPLGATTAPRGCSGLAGTPRSQARARRLPRTRRARVGRRPPAPRAARPTPPRHGRAPRPPARRPGRRGRAPRDGCHRRRVRPRRPGADTAARHPAHRHGWRPRRPRAARWHRRIRLAAPRSAWRSRSWRQRPALGWDPSRARGARARCSAPPVVRRRCRRRRPTGCARASTCAADGRRSLTGSPRRSASGSSRRSALRFQRRAASGSSASAKSRPDSWLRLGGTSASSR